MSDLLKILPREILISILSWLDAKSLISTSTTCHEMHEIVTSTAELDFVIKAFKRGLLPTYRNASTTPHADLIKELVDWDERWSSLDWKTYWDAPFTGVCNAYELVAGTFIKMTAEKPVKLEWTQLNAEESILQRRLLTMDCRDFAIDPTQDLIVYFQHGGQLMNVPGADLGNRAVLYIRTLSKDTKHPSAKEDTIYLDFSTTGLLLSAFMQVADDIVGLFLRRRHTGYRLVLLNWKNGQVLYDLSTAENTLSTATSDFSFLSPRAYIICRTTHPAAIDLFSFGDAVHAHEEGEEGAMPTLKATFLLPDVKPGVTVQSFHAHSGPLTADSASFSNKPFTIDPSQRIHALSLTMHTPDAHFDSVMLCVHQCIFNRFLRDPALSYESSVFAVPWADWGPLNTRAWYMDTTHAWLRYAHGLRVMMPPIAAVLPDGRGVTTLRLLEFVAPHRSGDCTALLERKVVSDNFPDTGMHEEASCEPAAEFNRFFKEPLVTALPYHYVKMNINGVILDAVMLDDEGVLGITTTDTAGFNMERIHYFEM